MANRVGDLYPVLEAANLLARYARGEQTCTWWQEDLGNIGTITVRDLLQDGVVLQCDLRSGGIYYPTARHATLPLYRRKEQSVRASREYFDCPRCHKARSKLFLVVGEWACRVCHKLKNRSSREGSLIRLWKEKDELSFILSNGRIKRMRETTYRTKLDRLERVTELIAGRTRPVYNERLGIPIVRIWS